MICGDSAYGSETAIETRVGRKDTISGERCQLYVDQQMAGTL